MKKQPAEGKSAGRFLHIGCISACFGIRAGFVLEFAPRQYCTRAHPPLCEKTGSTVPLGMVLTTLALALPDWRRFSVPEA